MYFYVVYGKMNDWMNEPSGRGEGTVLPSNGLMGMCCWMGLHFQDWIDYNGVALSLELLEWQGTFWGFGGSGNSGR